MIRYGQHIKVHHHSFGTRIFHVPPFRGGLEVLAKDYAAWPQQLWDSRDRWLRNCLDIDEITISDRSGDNPVYDVNEAELERFYEPDEVTEATITGARDLASVWARLGIAGVEPVNINTMKQAFQDAFPDFVEAIKLEMGDHGQIPPWDHFATGGLFPEAIRKLDFPRGAYTAAGLLAAELGVDSYRNHICR